MSVGRSAKRSAKRGFEEPLRPLVWAMVRDEDDGLRKAMGCKSAKGVR